MGTIVAFAFHRHNPPNPNGPSPLSRPQLLTFLSGKQHGIVVFCEILSDDGKNKHLFERGRGSMQPPPAELCLMTTAPRSANDDSLN